MFTNTNNQPLPLVVIDEQGKRRKAKCVMLVVSEPVNKKAVIIQAVIELHKKDKD